MEKPKAHVQQWKKDIVGEIVKELPNYNTIALINLENLPSRQSQQIRSKIKEHAKLIITRKRLFKIAIEKSGKSDLKQLEEYMTGMPALILTNKNAFDLFKILKENMTSAPAKAGQTAPEDILVKAGPTPFAPGPIIGELGAANIVAGIEDGKVVIKKDSLVVKEGEKIPAEASGILARLDIKPMKIGLNLIVALEKGQLYERKLLDVDVDRYIENLKIAAINAKKLALGANILTPETITIKLQEAHMNAKKLALGAEVLCDETKEHLMKKAEAHATALKEKIPDVPIKDQKEEEKPEEKVEDKPIEEEAKPKKTEDLAEEPTQEIEKEPDEPKEEKSQSTDKESEDNQGGK